MIQTEDADTVLHTKGLLMMNAFPTTVGAERGYIGTARAKTAQITQGPKTILYRKRKMEL